MTKKMLLLAVSVVFLFLFVACGNNKNKEETEKPDTGDTEAVTDTDPTDTGDTEVVTDTDPTDIGDTEVIPDEDNNENDPGDGCTTSESYGKNFLTRDNVSEICYEKIAGAECYEGATPYNVEHLVKKLQGYEFVFNREECRDLNEKDASGNYKLIPCPDFIPEKFKLSQLAGCEIYTVLPEFDCIAPCPDIYFSTDNDYFKTVSYTSSYKNSADKDKMNLNSLSSDGKITFSSGYYAYDNSRRSTFTWSEKAEDGTEIEKGVRVYMEIADSNSDTGDDFEAVDVGECRHEEPVFSFRDRIYTDGSYWCNEYVEVTEKAENSIRFNWFGEMHCGADWEYGYKVEGIVENVLKVNILERDTDEIAVDCDNCCYLMPIEYTASTAEEIESLKGIEINYEGKNHTAYFEIK